LDDAGVPAEGSETDAILEAVWIPPLPSAGMV